VNDDTEHMDVPSPGTLAMEAAERLSLCAYTCRGVPDQILRYLAQADKRGRSRLQRLLDDWQRSSGALPCPVELA
jgi:hypothetical protein